MSDSFRTLMDPTRRAQLDDLIAGDGQTLAALIARLVNGHPQHVPELGRGAAPISPSWAVDTAITALRPTESRIAWPITMATEPF